MSILRCREWLTFRVVGSQRAALAFTGRLREHSLYQSPGFLPAQAPLANLPPMLVNLSGIQHVTGLASALSRNTLLVLV